MGDDFGAHAFAAAQAMVGTQFRPQGRNPATGLDCVGLIGAAYAAAGVPVAAPRGYPLRGWAGARIEETLAEAGFGPAEGVPWVGDVALIALAAGQFHLGILGSGSFVHAHAGLRRVVETPLDEAVLAAARWRLSGSPPAGGRADQFVHREYGSWQLWC